MSNTITLGRQLAVQFKPFISPGAESETDVDAFVNAMTSALDEAFTNEKEKITTRVKQLLSCIEYDKLSDYQQSVVDCLSKALDDN